MNYIDQIAQRIAEAAGDPSAMATEEWAPLFRAYAVLCRINGSLTTSEDVHDAWSAWCAPINPTHRSLIPFDELSPEVQALDDRYRDAIHAVALEVANAD